MALPTAVGSPRLSAGSAAFLNDANWLGSQYVDQGRTMKQIADLAGVSETTVLRALKRHGVEPRPRGGRVRQSAAALRQPETPAPRCPRPSKHPQLEDRGWLSGRYEQEGLTVREIAAELRASPASVHKALSNHQVPRRANVRRPAVTLGKFPQLRDEMPPAARTC